MKRVQLTLFLDKVDSFDFEEIRKKYNPIQQILIDSHITVCKEDEILDLKELRANLRSLSFKSIRLEFGKPQRFSEGRGVLLPVWAENGLFSVLRTRILEGIIEHPKEHEPHLTLMHPRNSTCTEAIFQDILSSSFPAYTVCKRISLIQQLNMGKWEILEEFPL